MNNLKLARPAVGSAGPDYWEDAVSASEADLDIIEKTFAVAVWRYAEGGTGTSADPWTHTDGTGGLKTAIAEAQSSGRRAVYMKGGHYEITADVDNLFSGLSILTDGPATVIQATDAANGGIRVVGTATTPIENVRLGSFHSDRSGGKLGSHVVTEHCQGCVFGGATVAHGGGSVFSIRNGTKSSQFGDIIGWDGVDRLVFQSGGPTVSNLQFSRIINEGNSATDPSVECIDFTGAEHIQIDLVYGEFLQDEVLDMKSTRYCVVQSVVAVGCRQAVLLAPEQSGFDPIDGNEFGSIIAIGRPSEFTGFSAGLHISGTSNDIEIKQLRIHHMLVQCSVAGIPGVSLSGTGNDGGDDQTLSNFWIQTDGFAIVGASLLVRPAIEDGYAESTGSHAIQLSGATGYNLDDPTLRNVTVKAPAGTGINIDRFRGLCRVEDCRVLEALNGIRVLEIRQSNGAVGASIARNKVSECGENGIEFGVEGATDAPFTPQIDIKDNWVWNVGKSGTSDEHAAIHQNALGSGTPHGFAIDGNRIFDTQTTKTTRAYAFSGRNWYTRRNNTVTCVVSVVTPGSPSADGADSLIANNLETTSCP